MLIGQSVPHQPLNIQDITSDELVKPNSSGCGLRLKTINCFINHLTPNTFRKKGVLTFCNAVKFPELS